MYIYICICIYCLFEARVVENICQEHDSCDFVLEKTLSAENMFPLYYGSRNIGYFVS